MNSNISATDQQTNVKEALIREMRTRADALRRRANFTLVLIVVFIITGLAIFLFAGTITQIDTRPTVLSSREHQFSGEVHHGV